MAGGVNAAATLCLDCLGKAVRIHEGIENDRYRCDHCGQEFGIDWRAGEAKSPCWPPTETDLDLARQLKSMRAARKARDS